MVTKYTYSDLFFFLHNQITLPLVRVTLSTNWIFSQDLQKKKMYKIISFSFSECWLFCHGDDGDVGDEDGDDGDDNGDSNARTSPHWPW